MKNSTPESLGIPSACIKNYLQALENAGLAMHDVLIARHGEICCEAYWKPFDQNFAHRLYSVSKSFVSIAIGFLVQEGKVDIHDPILKYFPEEEPYIADEGLKQQTVLDMLRMTTVGSDGYWFPEKPADRVKHYFETKRDQRRTPGTLFEYDSSGSFVLCALAERVSGKSILNYLRERLFDKIGMSQNIETLICPGGHTWGDSAFIMPARDFLKFAQFVLRKGEYNGEQILNRDFMEQATSKQSNTNNLGEDAYNRHGYGYLIWRTYDNCYSLNGMGSQFAICVPHKDLVMVCNADNQGIQGANNVIFDKFFELVVPYVQESLTQDCQAQSELLNYIDTLQLNVAKGDFKNDFANQVDGKEFKMAKNAMGITKFSLSFSENAGVFRYTNAQGDKEIPFGMGKNIYSQFPETGYAKECGTVSSPGHTYKCAASAAWSDAKKLYIRVQIIDKYFGNLHINIGFNEKNQASICMQKHAEDFLQTYQGFAAQE